MTFKVTGTTPFTCYSLSRDGLRKYGIERQHLSDIIHNLPSVHSHYQQYLDKYYLIYWEPAYLRSQIIDGQITHKDTTYNVVYNQRNGHNYRPIPAHDAEYRQVALSFRRPRKEFILPPVVFITGISIGSKP